MSTWERVIIVFLLTIYVILAVSGITLILDYSV